MSLNPPFITKTREGYKAVVTKVCSGVFTLLGYYTVPVEDTYMNVSTAWTSEGKYFSHPNMKTKIDLVSVPENYPTP